MSYSVILERRNPSDPRFPILERLAGPFRTKEWGTFMLNGKAAIEAMSQKPLQRLNVGVLERLERDHGALDTKEGLKAAQFACIGFVKDVSYMSTLGHVKLVEEPGNASILPFEGES